MNNLKTITDIKVGSAWLHKNGSIYTVMCLANARHAGVSYAMKPGAVVKVNEYASDDRRDEYPNLLLIVDKDRTPVAVEPFQVAAMSRGEKVELPTYVIYRGENGAIWGKRPEGFLRSRTLLEETWGRKP